VVTDRSAGNRSNWARGSKDYLERADARQLPAQPEADLPEGPPVVLQTLQAQEERARYEDTGLTWGSFDVDAIRPTEVGRSRARFRAHLPELIWNTAALEGNTFTLPEVRTLLEGVTVGGKRIADEQQIMALSEAYNCLDELVGSHGFSMSKKVSDELNRLAARHEAIEAGHFRGEGQVTGGGSVRPANGGVAPGSDPGPHGENLRVQFDDLVEHLQGESDPRRRALVYFASATRRQFYFDGNKRTARLMMAGELMSSGFDIVSVPYARRLEFNNALDTMFADDDATELLRFLTTCTISD
jgi:Fic family protein